MEVLKLHQYQHDAIDFVHKVKTPFLAIDMGLGKTAIVLEFLRKYNRKAIVFGPLGALINTWPDEIDKWTPSLSWDILHGPTKDYTLRTSNPDILLVNYHGLKWFFNAVQSREIKWTPRDLVLDESSMVKSPTTQRFKMFKKMNPLWTDYRMCLSATPSPNGLQDLWTQYFLLDQGKRLTEVYYRFRNNYFHYTGPPLYKTTPRKGALKAISDKVKPITFRLEAEDYLKMPKLIHNEIKIELPKRHRDNYKFLENNFFLEFMDDESATAFNAGALSMKLRQFLQGAIYLDTEFPTTKKPYQLIHKLKIEALKELVESAAGNPILCPIQFKFEREMINKEFKRQVPCIAGGVKPFEARSFIKAWNKGDLPLLLCHPASIGHGTNLQGGGHIILWYGIPWNLEHYIQLNGRVYRQGQKNAVVINHLVVRDTIDEQVVKVLKQKGATQTTLLKMLKNEGFKRHESNV